MMQPQINHATGLHHVLPGIVTENESIWGNTFGRSHVSVLKGFPRTDRTEFVRDFQNSDGPCPILDFEFFWCRSGMVRSETNQLWSGDPWVELYFSMFIIYMLI